MSNYLSQGTSLDDFIKMTQTGEKLPFPYEWFDSFEKLNYTGLPPMREWYSSLKKKNITVGEYITALKIWKKYKMKTFADYLKYYNNNDITPFVKAIEFMRNYFQYFHLDMFKDGVSLPGMALKMMVNKSQEGFDEFKTQLPPSCDFISEIDKKYIERKINQYKEQDIKAKRALDYYITVNEIEQLLLKYNHRCVYCWDPE